LIESLWQYECPVICYVYCANANVSKLNIANMVAVIDLIVYCTKYKTEFNASNGKKSKIYIGYLFDFSRNWFITSRNI